MNPDIKPTLEDLLAIAEKPEVEQRKAFDEMLAIIEGKATPQNYASLDKVQKGKTRFASEIGNSNGQSYPPGFSRIIF